jgi:hypothetical protein
MYQGRSGSVRNTIQTMARYVVMMMMMMMMTTTTTMMMMMMMTALLLKTYLIIVEGVIGEVNSNPSSRILYVFV